MDTYFIRYTPEEHKQPYKAPEALKKKLTALGIEIMFEGQFFPDIIGKIPDEKIEEFEKIAEKYSTQVEIISEETREGVQLREMGKFAAILRYEMH